MGAGGDRLRACDLLVASFGATSRFTTVPEDLDAYIKDDLPLIAAMWHGQHLMMPFARPATMDRLAVLISRHEDAGAQALAAERLGITPVRGSGGPGRPRLLQGRRAGDARTPAPARIGLLGRDDRRRAQARAGGGDGDRDARQALRTSDRSDRGGHEPAHSVQHLGSRLARTAVRARGRRRRRLHPRFARRRRRGDGGRAARGRARARRGAPAGPTPWSARATPAPISDAA